MYASSVPLFGSDCSEKPASHALRPQYFLESSFSSAFRVHDEFWEEGEHHPCHCHHCIVAMDRIDGNCIRGIGIGRINCILISLTIVVEAKEAVGIHL